jgi:hypothetical protein
MRRTKNSTFEIFGIWSSVHNPHVNYGEFAAIGSHNPVEIDVIKRRTGLGRLNEIAIRQMQVLTYTAAIKQLKG